jgi:hypothetical protein
MLKIDRKVFNENLLLTQTYCEMQLANTDKSAAEILRSFNPEYDGKQVFSYEFNTYKQVIWTRDPLYNDLYDKLFEDQMLHKRNTVILSDTNIEFKGRILLAEVDTTITDGASESVSEGFIDGNDCPPIDTWFYNTQNSTGRVFYAWIPEQFIALTQNAIDVNAIECITWENDSISREEFKVPYHYTYQTQFPPAEKHKNTIFWVLGVGLLIRLIASLVK